MSLTEALAAITFAYKSDAAFVASGLEPIVFPGDPDADELTEVNEQQNEWPTFLLFEGSGYDRLFAHAGATYRATYTVRLIVETLRQDSQRALAELRAIRPHVHRVWWSSWLNGRFAGTVPFVGDPAIGGGTPPLRWEIAESTWGEVPTLRLSYEADITLTEAL